MKLSKKLMLFEEFSAANAEVAAPTAPTTQTSSRTSNVETDRTAIRTDIVNDVDSIISRLEDLANNLNDSNDPANEAFLNENAGVAAADKVLSAELYMIPLVAAGVLTGAGVGAVVLIKRAITKMKLRSKHRKTVLKNKLQAAKMELYLKDLRGQESDEKVQAKKEGYQKKIEELNKAADEFHAALLQKYDKYKDFLGTLNSEAKLKVAEMMLGSKSLTDSEKAKYQEMYDNAEESLQKTAQKAADQEQKAKDAKANANGEQQAQIKAEEENLDKKMEEAGVSQEQKNSKEGQLKRVEDLIAKEKEKPEPSDDKLAKLNALKDKIAAKESWNLLEIGTLLLECEIDEFEIEELV